MGKSKSNGVINFDSYHPRTISIFEVIGSYFVDIYFNHIYANSKINNEQSITDEYKKQVQVYMTSIKSDHSVYSDTLKNLYDFYKIHTSYKTITFSDFIDHIVSEIIPEEFFESFTNKEKDELLGSTIYDIVTGIGIYVTNIDILPKIIDHHHINPAVTVRIIQDYAVTLLLIKRDYLQNQLIKKNNQMTSGISQELLQKMNRQLIRLAKDKSNLVYKLDKANKTIDRLYDELKHHKKLEIRLKKQIEELMEEETEYEEESESEEEETPPKKLKKKQIQEESKKSKNKSKEESKKNKNKNKNKSKEDNIQPTLEEFMNPVESDPVQLIKKQNGESIDNTNLFESPDPSPKRLLSRSRAKYSDEDFQSE